MSRSRPNNFLNFTTFINADVALVTCPRCGNGFERVVGRRISCLHCAWTPAPGPRCRCQGWRCPDPAAPAWDHTLELHCPRCGSVREEVRPLRPDHSPTPPMCACGARMQLTPRGLNRDRIQAAHNVPVDHDGLTGLPFHLRTRYTGHILWAANLDHLSHLEEFVGAARRPRKEPGAPHDLGHSLPRWMIRAGNRAEVLAALTHLRELAARALAVTTRKDIGTGCRVR